MLHNIEFFISLSLLFPFILSFIRYNNGSINIKPLFYLLLIGVINEIVTYLITAEYKLYFKDVPKLLPYNIYTLFDFLLIIVLLRRWANILHNDLLYGFLMISLTIIWVWEYIVQANMGEISLFYNVTYFFVIIMVSVSQINWLVVNKKDNLLVNTKFLISLGFVIYFTYSFLFEIIYYYSSETMRKSNIFGIYPIINLLTNVLLGLGILCIPRKPIFIKP